MSTIVIPELRCDPFVDLSGWNVPINPDIMFPKIHGAIIRSNIGTIPDKHFAPTRQLFEERNMPWTGYMFFYADVNRKEQAHCTAEQQGRWDDDGYHLEGQFGSYDDLEPPSRPAWMPKSTFTTRYIEYYNHWVNYTGEHVKGIYSAKWFVEAYLTNQIKWYADQGLMRYWAAHWNVDNPTIPYQFKDATPSWWLHQYEGTGNRKGAEYGVGGADIDLNEYYAQCSTFASDWDIGGVIPEPPEPEPEPEPEPPEFERTVKTNVYGLRQRTSPETVTTKNVVGFFTKDAVLNVDGIVTDNENRPWYHIGEQIYFAAWLCTTLSTAKTYASFGINI